MSKVLIIGATSAMAEHCARIWAGRGDELFLVGRHAERLTSMGQDLKVRGAHQTHTHCIDLNQLEHHASVLEAASSAMGGIDQVLIAHGTLSDQAVCQHSVAKTLEEIRTNALSTIGLLTLLADRLQAQRSGTICVISSVAGDRGRANNYVYGSAKAMVTTFASGLRQRLHASNVSVVTIKPGFVDTPMTAALKKGLLWAQPGAVAARIVRAMDAREGEVYVPGFWRAIMFIIRNIPTKLFVKTTF